jgi:hypothetical protein
MQSKDASKRELLRPSANRIWEAGAGDLMWIGILIAAPQDRFSWTAGGEICEPQGPSSNHAMRWSDLCLWRMEYALMQCSLGSRSGTSGVRRVWSEQILDE